MGLHIHVDGSFIGNGKDGKMNFNMKYMSKCDEDINFTSKKLMLQTDLNTVL